MTSAQQRVYGFRARLDEDMQNWVLAMHAKLNPNWVPWLERGCRTQPGRCVPVPAAEVEAPPDILKPAIRRIREIGRITQIKGFSAPVNPDPISEMTCGGKQWGNGVCRNCGATFAKSGSTHRDCSPKCRKIMRNAYQREYMKTLSPEKRNEVRGKRKKATA